MLTMHPELSSRLIVEHVCDGIVLTDPEGCIQWVNPAFSQMSGYELEDLLGRRPGDVLQGPKTAPESKAILRKAISSRSRCRVDIVNYSKKREPYISQINLSPVFSAEGDLIHFVAVQRDVTQERELAQDSIDFQAYQRALEMQAIVSVADKQGVITYTNSKFCDISGYERSELLGKSHSVINSGYHHRKFFRDMWRIIINGGTWHGEVCNRTKSGDLYWVDTTIVPVHGSQGEIMRYVSTGYDITDRKNSEIKLVRQAETDSLTGIANRARFVVDLEAECLKVKEGKDQAGLIVLMIDLDHFKDLNDSLGHHMGDLLLKEIARRLCQHAGEDGFAARMGGDEFAMVVSKISENSPEDFVRSLHASLSDAAELDGVIYLPSVSIGVALYPTDANSAEGVILNADVALYDAKRDGRRTWNFFDPKTRQRLDHRKRLKSIVETAIDAASFDIMLQPICACQTREHRGFEVLARLTHEGEAVPPDQFIPIAEEFGLIPAVGRVVTQKALAAYHAMREKGLDPGRLALNVAAPQFREPGFIENLQDMLFQYGLAPDILFIEITETALIGRSTSIVAESLAKLRNLGARIALDDFGTGFSSLAHLRDFHVDKIKIDKSFVEDIESSQDDRGLVKGLVELARNLGLEVVAEGVETEEQAHIIEELGCHFIQGFVHSRALSIEDATAFLVEHQSGAPGKKLSA